MRGQLRIRGEISSFSRDPLGTPDFVYHENAGLRGGIAKEIN